jgi:hypothetical protein
MPGEKRLDVSSAQSGPQPRHNQLASAMLIAARSLARTSWYRQCS